MNKLLPRTKPWVKVWRQPHIAWRDTMDRLYGQKEQKKPRTKTEQPHGSLV